MDFQPQTPRQISEERLLPDGLYSFQVVSALEKPSKTSGTPMIELNLKITTDKGARFVPTYLPASNLKKLRQACVVCGLLEQYNSGRISGKDFLNRTGVVRVGTDQARDGFQVKNAVIAFVAAPRVLAGASA